MSEQTEDVAGTSAPEVAADAAAAEAAAPDASGADASGAADAAAEPPGPQRAPAPPWPAGTPGAAGPGPLAMATELVATPLAIARQMLPQGRSTKFYVGLGVASALGVIEWPVAGAIGLTYYLARRPG